MTRGVSPRTWLLSPTVSCASSLGPAMMGREGREVERLRLLEQRGKGRMASTMSMTS